MADTVGAMIMLAEELATMDIELGGEGSKQYEAVRGTLLSIEQCSQLEGYHSACRKLEKNFDLYESPTMRDALKLSLQILKTDFKAEFFSVLA